MYNLFLIGMLVYALLVLFIIISAFLGFLITRVPFVRTTTADIEFIVRKLNILSKDIFYDLGSGDGKVCLLVNKLTGATCKGFELTLWTHLLAKTKQRWFKSFSPFGGDARRAERVRFTNQNFFNANWSEANFIYGYLYPPLMGRVKEKFLNECKSGSVAVIRDFPFPGLKPDEVFFMPKDHEIYIYRK